MPLDCKKTAIFCTHSFPTYLLSSTSFYGIYERLSASRKPSKKKAIRITYNVGYRADTLPLFHDLETLKLSDLLEKHILKFMHNIYSYKKPIEFVDFWPLKSTYNYLLRPHTRFYTPLVKSVRLSHMPQFQFAQIFNNFPNDFKLIMERTDFINSLEEFYHDRYKSSTCNKTLCKFCAFIRWKSYKSKYVCSPKTFSYVKCN